MTEAIETTRVRTTGVVARVFEGLARVRRAPAFHPHGIPAAGTMEVHDDDSALGVALGVGRHRVDARLSLGAGLPRPLPDFLGIALRTTTGAGPFDLLMTTVGPGRYGSLVLAPSPRWTARRFSTLMPYVGPRGRVVIGLQPVRESTSAPTVDAARTAVATTGLDLDVVERSGIGPWRVVGRLHLDEVPAESPRSFDPVLNAHPALHPVRFLSGVRAAAYAGSRRGRGGRRGRPS